MPRARPGHVDEGEHCILPAVAPCYRNVVTKHHRRIFCFTFYSLRLNTYQPGHMAECSERVLIGVDKFFAFLHLRFDSRADMIHQLLIYLLDDNSTEVKILPDV